MADVQTFKNLQDKTLRWLDEAGDTDTTLALVKQFLQTAHKRRLTQERWPFMLWDSEETLTIRPGVQTYALHPEFLKPFYFWNATQQDIVAQYDEESIRNTFSDWHNDHGVALQMTLWGRTEVQNQPSSASVIAVTSSSSSADDGKVSVKVRGVTTDGVTTETIACGSSGTLQFTKILKVTKIGTWQGTMTLTANAGTVTVLKLFAAEYGRSYQQTFWLNIPDATETINYRFYRQPSPLVDDNDLLDIPTPFEDLIVYDALLDFATYNQYDAGTVQLWMRKQQELELALQQTYGDAKSIDAATPYSNYVPR